MRHNFKQAQRDKGMTQQQVVERSLNERISIS